MSIRAPGSRTAGHVPKARVLEALGIDLSSAEQKSLALSVGAHDNIYSVRSRAN